MNSLRKNIKWDEQDKVKLFFLVKQYVGENKRIDWKSVSKKLSERTTNQCKQYYRNVILDDQYEKGQINQKWSLEMKNQLMCRVSFYGKKWTFLQKNYYQNHTTMKLRQIFGKIQKSVARLKDVETMIFEENISQVDPPFLKFFQKILENFLLKEKSIQQQLQNNQETQMLIIDPIDLHMYNKLKAEGKFENALELLKLIKDYTH